MVSNLTRDCFPLGVKILVGDFFGILTFNIFVSLSNEVNRRPKELPSSDPIYFLFAQIDAARNLDLVPSRAHSVFNRKHLVPKAINHFLFLIENLKNT